MIMLDSKEPEKIEEELASKEETEEEINIEEVPF